MLATPGGKVTVDKVRASLARIGQAEHLASSAFEALISKHSYSTQVLRSYATFLRQVHNKPEEAERYVIMADQVEEEAAAERAASLAHSIGKRRTESDRHHRHRSDGSRARSPPGGDVAGDSFDADGYARDDEAVEEEPGDARRRGLERHGTRAPAAMAQGQAGARVAFASPHHATGVDEDADEASERGEGDDDEGVEVGSTDAVDPDAPLAGRSAIAAASSGDGLEGLLGSIATTVADEPAVLDPPSDVPASPAGVRQAGRRVSLDLGDGVVVKPGPARRSAEQRAQEEALARMAIHEADEVGRILGVHENDDDDDEALIRRVKTRRIIGTAEVDSEETNPRSWPGVRSFFNMLVAAVVLSLLFLLVPVGVNVNLLQQMRTSTLALSTSSRRESLVWMTGQVLADMESGVYWEQYHQNGTGAVGLKEIAGEMIHINHRLVFCNYPKDPLDSFAHFVDRSDLSCPRGVSNSKSLTRDVQGTLYDVQSTGTGEGGTISNPAAGLQIQVVGIPKLADDLAQQMTYFLLDALQNPGTFSPQTYADADPVQAFMRVMALQQSNLSGPALAAAVAREQGRQQVAGAELAAVLPFLYNVASTFKAMDSAAFVYTENANNMSLSFFVALAVITVIGVCVFAAIPCVMLNGLAHAHFERSLGWYVLQAVPHKSIAAALRTAEDEREDEITEATEMRRAASFEDVKELRDGPDGEWEASRSRQREAALGGARRSVVSKFGTFGYDINPQSVVAKELRKLEKCVCKGEVQVRGRRVPSLADMGQRFHASRRSIGATRMLRRGSDTESITGGGHVQVLSADADPLAWSTMGGQVGEATGISPGPSAAVAAAAGDPPAVDFTAAVSPGAAAGRDSKVVPSDVLHVRSGSDASQRSHGLASGGAVRRSAAAQAVVKRMPSDMSESSKGYRGSVGVLSPREGGAPKAGHEACCGRLFRRAVSKDPLEVLIERVKRHSLREESFRSRRRFMVRAGVVMVLLVVGLMSALIVTYSSVEMINRQFAAMGRYLSLYSQSGFEVSVRRARLQRTLTYATVVNRAANRSVFEAWYDADFATGSEPTVRASSDRLAQLVSTLELYHRCVVYGCSDLPNPLARAGAEAETVELTGVATSPEISEWFFGERAIDRQFKDYQSRLRQDSADTPPPYLTQSYLAVRVLPQLYAEAFESWANLYLIQAVVSASVLCLVVLGVAGYYIRVFIFQASVEVQRWRFVLSLLPDKVLEGIPLAQSYMVTTRWSDTSAGDLGEDFGIIDEEETNI